MARSDWQAMDYDSGMASVREHDHVRGVMREWANKPYRSYVIPAPRCSSWQAMDDDSGAGPDSHTSPNLGELDRLVFVAYSRINGAIVVLNKWEPELAQADRWLTEAQQALSAAYDHIGVNREYTL